VVAASVVAAVSILVLVIVMLSWSRRFLPKAKAGATHSGVNIIANHPLISYEELFRVTNNFDQANLTSGLVALVWSTKLYYMMEHQWPSKY